MNNYELITKLIIDRLEQGSIPWRSPFRGHRIPNSNFITKKPYKGVNALVTSMMGKASPYWITYKQMKEHFPKASNKGCKGIPILFAKYIEKEDADGNKTLASIYKRTYVFNIADIKDIDCPIMKELEENGKLDFNPIDSANELLDKLSDKIPVIYHKENYRALYRPIQDVIEIANKENFTTEDDYYATLFHEITHSTGHSSRCNRDMKGGKRSNAYAKEELVAEIGASFMCAEAGILNRTVESHSAYIQSWLKRFNDDKTLIIKASSMAQKAMDYLNINQEQLKQVS